MNTRQRYEIKLLAEQGKFDLEQIAASFDVSMRSVRYDIEALNQKLSHALEGNGGGSVPSSYLIGRGTYADKVVVRNKIAYLDQEVPRRVVSALASDPDDISAAPLPSDERVLSIVSMLCWSEDFITVQEFADEFQVSRATATRDLAKVYEYCEASGLAIERSRGKGVRATSDESVRRRVFARVVRDYQRVSSSHSSFEALDYLKWFPAEELTAIADIIREAERETGFALDDTAFEAIVIHVALSIKRCRSGIDFGAPLDEALLSGETDIEFKMADCIIAKIEEVFGIALPEEERYYIEVHMGARSGEVASALGSNGVGLEFACVQVIADVSRVLGIDLMHDYRLFSRVLQHVSGSVYRKKMGLLLENPMRDELLSSYAEHAEIIRQALVENGLDQFIVMNDDELSYILLHFETAVVSSDSREPRRPNVVVVCSTGFGTAELLAAEIGRYFDVNLIANIPAHQVPALTAEMGIDLVISTVPLHIDLRWVEVRPLLKEEDIRKISAALSATGFAALDASECTGPRAPLPPGQSKQEHPLGGYLLGDLIKDHIVLDAPATSWQDAVRAAGAPLVATGEITPEYIDATIANITAMGPYVVIARHVALPHASNRAGVRRTSMSCVRLAQPVAFGSKLNDPVRYAFMLACADATSHTQALVNLANLLQTAEFMDLLANATDPHAILDYVTSYERARCEQREGR